MATLCQLTHELVSVWIVLRDLTHISYLMSIQWVLAGQHGLSRQHRLEWQTNDSIPQDFPESQAKSSSSTFLDRHQGTLAPDIASSP